jgi:2-phosphosulfolactate phosphatase
MAPLEIKIGSLLDGAAQASGAVAIIDVFRAFTTAAVVLANGASKIIMVGSVDEALALRNSGEGAVCMGEVGRRMPAGFDFGNSPHEVSGIDFRGRTIIQRTSAGTQGIVAASGADSLYAAALVTASATARALRSAAPGVITLVAMGNNATARSDEDELCALHLRNLLEGRSGNPQAVREMILAGGEVGRFHDPARPESDPADLEIALDIDRYDLAIRVTLEAGRPVASIEKTA